MSDVKNAIELIAYTQEGHSIDRNMAVAAVLELIKADLSAAPTSTKNRLEHHMNLLSEYADKIEAAVKRS